MPCTNRPRPSLAPQPSMHRWREQSTSPKPAKHVHTPPAEHAPWLGVGVELGLGLGLG